MNKTGNIAVDMIAACLAHYKRFNRKIKTITLSHGRWNMFVEYSKKNRPETIIHDEIIFRNVTLKKGHRFMRENMEVELDKPVNAN
jgi:hypothetical protein